MASQWPIGMPSLLSHRRGCARISRPPSRQRLWPCPCLAGAAPSGWLRPWPVPTVQPDQAHMRRRLPIAPPILRLPFGVVSQCCVSSRRARLSCWCIRRQSWNGLPTCKSRPRVCFHAAQSRFRRLREAARQFSRIRRWTGSGSVSPSSFHQRSSFSGVLAPACTRGAGSGPALQL